MASTSRLGGAMLSRLAAPSPYLSMVTSRAFSTSLALRANPPKSTPEEAPAPRRLNPLIGNFLRSQDTAVAEPEPVEAPKQAKAPKTEAPKQTETEDLPPPPPPAATPIAPPSAPKHAYTASKDFNLDLTSFISAKADAFSQRFNYDPLTQPQVRAKAVTGRTIFMNERARKSPSNSHSPAEAFQTLERLVRNDKVKNKFHSQKFHERKGLKRKRLRSQRWRTRFKKGFKETVSRVLELKRQGW